MNGFELPFLDRGWDTHFRIHRLEKDFKVSLAAFLAPAARGVTATETVVRSQRIHHSIVKMTQGHAFVVPERLLKPEQRCFAKHDILYRPDRRLCDEHVTPDARNGILEIVVRSSYDCQKSVESSSCASWVFLIILRST